MLLLVENLGVHEGEALAMNDYLNYLNVIYSNIALGLGNSFNNNISRVYVLSHTEISE